MARASGGPRQFAGLFVQPKYTVPSAPMAGDEGSKETGESRPNDQITAPELACKAYITFALLDPPPSPLLTKMVPSDPMAGQERSRPLKSLGKKVHFKAPLALFNA